MDILYLPKMSKVISYVPEFASTHGRCSRRAMVDGDLTRAQKEMIAVVVSAVNACEYWTVDHTAAGKLLGYGNDAYWDAYWYEAAYFYGATNGTNAVADGLRLPYRAFGQP